MSIKRKDSEVQPHLEQAYKKLEQGDFQQAEEHLEEALGVSFDHEELLAALKCTGYWKNAWHKYLMESSPLEKSEFLQAQWKGFVSRFLLRIEGVSERIQYSIKTWVFRSVLQNYMESLNEVDGQAPEIRLKMGRAHKALGDYDKAILELDKALKDRPSGEIYAELADCYAMIGELRFAKVFFREAFYHTPNKIEVEYLESELILRLIRQLRDEGKKDRELREWVPIYGVLYGVFNIKRELKPVELGQLKQSIYSLNLELQEKPEERIYLLPRLLNRYFWLIDHYISIKEDRSRINEVLKSIRLLDSNVYEKYIN